MNVHVISRCAVGVLRNRRILDILIYFNAESFQEFRSQRFRPSGIKVYRLLTQFRSFYSGRSSGPPSNNVSYIKFQGPVSDIVFEIDQRHLPNKHLATSHHIIVQICTDGSGVTCLFDDNSMFMIHAVYVHTYLMIFEVVRNWNKNNVRSGD